jgi:1,2-diacylglycerol 3-beta-galactosyltransferase
LWRLGYTFTQPRLVHVPMQHVMGLIMGRQISQAFEHYQPDLVVSVHPLMQVTSLSSNQPLVLSACLP